MKQKRIFNLRLDEDEYELLKKDAYRHEKSMSEYVRWLIENQRKVDKA